MGEAEMAEKLFGGYFAAEAKRSLPECCQLKPAFKAATREASLELEDEIISPSLRGKRQALGVLSQPHRLTQRTGQRMEVWRGSSLVLTSQPLAGRQPAPGVGRELIPPQECPWCGRDTGYLEL